MKHKEKKINLSHGISRAQSFFYSRFKQLHGIRIALAFTLTFLVFRELHSDKLDYIIMTLISILMPMPYWGNVLIRSMQRTLGTVIGSLIGMLLLYTETHSFPLMLALATIAMFVCGLIALGKNMYVGMLIGMTISIVATAPVGDMDSALIRSAQTVGGSILALVFSAILPLKGFVFWRMNISTILRDIARLYDEHIMKLSSTDPERWDNQLKDTLSTLLTCNTYIAPAVKETHVPAATFTAIHGRIRRLVAILELLTDTFSKNYFAHALNTENPYIVQLQKSNSEIMKLLSDIFVLGKDDDTMDKLQALRASTHELHQKINAQPESNSADAMMVGMSVEVIKLLDEVCGLVQIDILKKCA
ncbi:FUSC family protein [Morganella morganii]|uniref:FUSC family protein n=1 Tax=Morganella morganii TaxID=582 RepID=UPI001BD93812|nr:FUSC family protein [Morganella morganii]EKU4003107.1 FUSC family protein [Morganella morganii]MBT0405600.1 FUSC family protein [Morganella morganii subsp. morganii]MBT0424199.1 FUSC family protein [Morganella morganii subsp. morganii]MBT0471690.1 FUSC family protein [Morganella morganii subsp. morganii]QWM00236.1 FUSC family protein [Morganella morganii subsp. morganii]